MDKPEETITEKFKKYFTIQIASSPESLEAIYKLRYEVFCKEFGFEKEEDCKNQREHDLYDDKALHCTIYHNATHEAAGCIRLLLPHAYSQHLPVEGYSTLKDFSDFCEFSRLTVSKSFRRRHGDPAIATGMSPQVLTQAQQNTMHRNFPIVPVGLMLAGLSLTTQLNFENGFAMMEPKLARAMHAYGIHFEQVGEIVNYHGERAAFRMHPKEIWKSIHPELKEFLNYIHEELRENTLKWQNKSYNRKMR